MTVLQACWASLRRVGKVIYQGHDMSARSGVWVTRISREAAIAQVLPFILLVVGNLVWWYVGRSEKQWATVVLMLSVVPLALASTCLAHWLDKQPDLPPSTKTFVTWAVLTTLCGVPLGHLFLYVGQQIEPITSLPNFVRFFPELMAAFIILTSYWRLVIVRLWYERLATEELKRHTAEQGQALAEARLHMLKAQIEPHFLFNTLASVQHLVRTDPAQADFLLTRLVSYLRQAIPDLRGTASTLGRELASVETYLDIVRVRMGGRLEVEVRCDPQLAEVPFPSLIVHTLVENAIKHGVELKPGPVRIAVLAREAAQGSPMVTAEGSLPCKAGPLRRGAVDRANCPLTIAISVQDNGVGFGTVETVGGGVGLRNIRDRLALAYDGRARLEITDAPGGGVLATVTIPRSQA